MDDKSFYEPIKITTPEIAWEPIPPTVPVIARWDAIEKDEHEKGRRAGIYWLFNKSSRESFCLWECLFRQLPRDEVRQRKFFIDVLGQEKTDVFQRGFHDGVEQAMKLAGLGVRHD